MLYNNNYNYLLIAFLVSLYYIQVSMEEASWGALVAGMAFLWLMTVCC
jgi:hypothetical protein